MSTLLPYGDFVVGRGAFINGRVKVKQDDGTEVGFDLSSGRWEIHLRAYEDPANSRLAYQRPIAASTTGAADGYYGEEIPAFTTAYTYLVWEEVRVDTQVADDGSVSGFSEVRLRSWTQPIKDAPQLPPV